jgi:hypothetical protein
MAGRYITTVNGESATEEAFTEPPDVQQITCFLEWLAVTRKGVIEKHVTVRNRLASLKRAIKLCTQYQYSQVQNKESENYITQELTRDDRVSTYACPKPRAPKNVAVDLIDFLSICDENKQLHQRMRNQMSFAVQLFLLLGVQPG